MQKRSHLSRVAVAVATAALALGSVAPAAAQEDEQFTIGWSVAYFDHPVYQLMMDGARVAAEERGVEVIFGDGKNDPAVQASDIDNYLAQGVDAILLTPTVADPLIPAVKKVNAEGLPFLVVDRRMYSQGTGITWDALVGWDMVKSGTVGGQQVVEALTQPDGTVAGKVVVMEGTAGAGSTIDRGTAFYEVLSEHPDIEVIYKVDGDFKRDKGLTLTEDILQRFPPDSFDVIYYMNDEMALGGLQAIKDAGRLGEFTIVSVDGEKEALDALRRGEIDYDGIFFPQDQGYIGINVIADLLEGKAPDWCNYSYEGRVADCVEFEGKPWVRPSFFGVDQTNADEPQNQGW
jgi:ABC-type sugar transport system substrate-binding protein